MNQVRFLGDRDEHVGRYGAELLGVPAQQRLEADDLEPFACDDRLIDEAEFAFPDRLAKSALDAAAEADRFVHALIEHAHDAAAIALGVFKREIGAAHHVDRIMVGAGLGKDEAGRRAALHRMAE